MDNKYLGKVNGFIVPFLTKNGYSLIKSEFVNEDNNYYLRLYIDLTSEEASKRAEELRESMTPEEDMETDAAEAEAEAQSEEGNGDGEAVPGIGINDCARVSRYLSKWLDKEDFIKEAYTLEVCSRGFLNVPESGDEIKGETT